MGKKIKVVLNRSEVRKQLLQSKEIQDVVKGYAYRAQARLGDGYEVTYQQGKNRVNAEIAATTRKTRRENLLHNTILKALGGVSQDN